MPIFMRLTKTLLFVLFLLPPITCFSQWTLSGKVPLIGNAQKIQYYCSVVSTNQDTITLFGGTRDSLVLHFKEGTEKHFLGNASFMVKCYADGRKIAFKVLPFHSKWNGYYHKARGLVLLADEYDKRDTIQVCDLSGNVVTSFVDSVSGFVQFREDTEGNVFFVFQGSGTIGIRKYDPQYQLLWHKATPNPDALNQVELREIEVLTDDNSLLVYGNMESTWDLDPGPGQHIISTTPYMAKNRYNRDVFLAKYDKDGNLLWGHSFGGSGLEEIAFVAYPNGQLLHSFDTSSDTLFVDGNKNRLLLPKQSPNSLAHVFFPIQPDGSIDSTHIRYLFSQQNFTVLRLDGSEFSLTEEFHQRFNEENALYLLYADSSKFPILAYPGAQPLPPFPPSQKLAVYYYDNGFLPLGETSNFTTLEASLFPLYLDGLQKLGLHRLDTMKNIQAVYLTDGDSLLSILHYTPRPLVTGIENTSHNSSSIALSPNPNHGAFLLSGTQIQNGDIARIYTVEHVGVQEKILEGTQTKIAFDLLHSGLYFCEIYRQNERIAVLRFVKE